MARRQVTKTVIPGDSSSLATELSIQGASSKGEIETQLEIKPALLKDFKENQHDNHEELLEVATPGQPFEQGQVSAGTVDEQRLSATKDNCPMETLDPMECCSGHQASQLQQEDVPASDHYGQQSGGNNLSHQLLASSGTADDMENPDVGNAATKDGDPISSDSISAVIPVSAPIATKGSSSTSVTPRESKLTPKDSVTSKDTEVSSTPKGTDMSPIASIKVKGSNSTPPALKSPFLCSCGRNFDTRRGLSIHLAHEPKHFNCASKKTSSDSASNPHTTKQPEDAQDSSHNSPSSPVTRNPSPPPPHSPTSSTPSSPTLFNMKSFKPSPRNPQYYSIIRTRRGNVAEISTSGGGSGLSPEVGAKRPRSSGGVAGSPAKTMLLNSGEKIATHSEEVPNTTPESGSGKKRSKDSSEVKGKDGASGGRLRVRSLSGGSDTASPPTGSVSRGLAVLNSVLQEFGLRSSPITRSNAASMKAHEFISLPSRRKRGKRGGWRGGWRGGVVGRGHGGEEGKHNVSSEDNASEVGDDFDGMDTKSEEDKSEKSESVQDDSKTPTSVDNPPIQPPKRKRGRPPKVRKDTPSTSPASGITIVKSRSSPSLSLSASQSSPPVGPISSSTRSGKSHGRGGGKVGGHVKIEVSEESPLPSKVDVPTSKVSSDNSGNHVTSSPAKLDLPSATTKSEVDNATATPTSPDATDTPTAHKVDLQTHGSDHVTGTRSRSKQVTVAEERESENESISGRKKCASEQETVVEESRGESSCGRKTPATKASEREIAESGSGKRKKARERGTAVEENEGESSSGRKKPASKARERGTALEESESESSSGRKKTASKNIGSKTPNRNIIESKDQSPMELDSSDQKAANTDAGESKESKEPESSTLSASKELKSKRKSKKSTPKSQVPSKSDKGEHKKSVSESEEAESDYNTDTAKSDVVEAEVAGEKRDTEDPVPPTAQIPLPKPRQSSVIVSVLSVPEKKEESQSGPGSGSAEEQASAESSKKENQRSSSTSERDLNLQQQMERRVSETSPVFPYSNSSTPTPTYPQFPLGPGYPGTFPHPHMMYSSGPASSMYSPHFYGYPGPQPLQMAPHHPLPHGSYFPTHMAPPTAPPNTTGDQNLPSPQAMHPHTSFNNIQTFPPNSVNASTPTSSTTPPIITSVATTMGGVRVSVLDKPPTHLPMVSVPYHMPSATPPRPPRPPGGYPMDLPPGHGMRYMASGAHSPDGMEPRPHPLSQVYRPGMMGPYPPPSHMHPYPIHAVRLDPTVMPYMDWTHEPRPPPSEEHPAHPVECPECGRVFKNNKALNGHMRLHGGFDWTKKPFTNTDQAKQQSNGSSSAVSAMSPTKDNKTPAVDANSKSKPMAPPTTTSSSSSSSKSAGKRKRSRSSSSSRSRSRSPSAHSMVTKTGKPKRKKSSDDSSHTQKQSNLPKGESRNKEKESSAAVTSQTAPLPIPRAPSIFTFDSNSTPPHHNKPTCPSSVVITSSSSTTSTPSSEGHDNGGSTLTHSGSTLDDLCRAAAELERMDTSHANNGRKEKKAADSAKQQHDDVDELGRKRPKNISIPQVQTPSPAIERERHRLGGTPPYTPPPILSPSRSLIHLAPGVGQANNPAPCTPNRILQHWSSYGGRKVSETEEGGFSEPRINIGEEFQAKLPKYVESKPKCYKGDSRATLLWKPLDNLTEEDESVIDGYMELACSPAILHGGRNKELAVHLLHALGGSIKEAVRWLLSGKTLFDGKSGIGDYNYSGSRRWSGRERQQFRRAWKVHRKQFNMLRSTIDSKKFSDMIEYYYTWKKYCSDEYRGRNRHISEEIFSDEDDLTYPQVPSSSSSGSGDSEQSTNAYTNDLDTSKTFKPPRNRKNEKPIPSSSSANNLHFQQSAGSMKLLPPELVLPHPQSRMFNNNLPIVYAPHSSPAMLNQHIHQFPCKYPGCNQVFTSIFALNGHIRVHGGSFFPKPNGGPNQEGQGFPMGSSHSQMALSNPPSSSSSNSASPSVSFPTGSRLQHSSSAHSSLHYSHKSHHHHSHHHHHHHSGKSFAELELAKALLELPGSHSSIPSSKSLGGYHTPSPKPSPGKGKGVTGAKKKLTSSSPGEHEGYYPCNRCGRVFTKVKSRSAHMKSHVIKPN